MIDGQEIETQAGEITRMNGLDDRNREHLLRLLSGRISGRTAFCPEDQAIAGYFEGSLAETERQALERHLVDCSYCLTRIGSLERLETRQDEPQIPEEILASAKQLQHPEAKRKYLSTPVWATAAVLVLALFLVIGRDGGLSHAPAVPASGKPSIGQEPRRLRSIKPLAREVEILSPNLDAGVYPGTTIRWSENSENTDYRIFILSESGDVLWTERLQDPEWTVRGSPQLAAGTEYYLRVEAYLPDGETLSSAHRVFRLAGGR